MSGPIATVLVLAYRQEAFVQAAAEAALAQTGGPYEVIFSDDASPDGTFDVLRRVAERYRGPHRIVLRRNDLNLGICGHYNALAAVAQGELLVTAAGDDISLPGRVEILVQTWERHGRRPDLIASNLVDMAPDGTPGDEIVVDALERWPTVDDWARRRPYVVGAAHAFTRRLWDRFGPLRTDLASEDQFLTFRAIASGGALTVPHALVRWRRGGLSAPPDYANLQSLRQHLCRELRRDVAGRESLLSDARTAGCADIVEPVLRPGLRRSRYHLDLAQADHWAARWALVREARDLPWGWRLRKALHLQWPQLSLWWRARRQRQVP